MEKLLEIKNLSKYFPIKKGFFNKQVGNIYAVNNLSFDIYKGETLGIVGESGCGKSTTGRCILNLIDITEGQIIFKGKDIAKLKGKELKDIRAKMQIIFQNPQSSLDPRATVKDIISEPLFINTKLSKKEIAKRVDELLGLVGLSKNCLNNYPHEFSGGQRQRIGIARALALNPEFIVADEPVSALDVSIQAQIINLLDDLKKELGLTYLFISHDLSVVRHFCDRVAVMYLGEIVEIAKTEDLFKNPSHPYTKSLLSAIPVIEPGHDLSKRILLKGDLPSPANPPEGCKFHTRCPQVKDICRNAVPSSFALESGHIATCHLLEE
jgi:oligopeptide/dipeptide ABC transporter ATP-binding protein